MVKVWTYSNNPGLLYTNEDCGASIDDEIYKDAIWYGPIEPPEFPPK
jgi:hypothetical protein